jgi:hypothetical protein
MINFPFMSQQLPTAVMQRFSLGVDLLFAESFSQDRPLLL